MLMQIKVGMCMFMTMIQPQGNLLQVMGLSSFLLVLWLKKEEVLQEQLLLNYLNILEHTVQPLYQVLFWQYQIRLTLLVFQLHIK